MYIRRHARIQHLLCIHSMSTSSSPFATYTAHISQQPSRTMQFMTLPSMPDTAWQPDEGMNRRIQDENHLSNNWRYRQYMQHNAKRIMKYNTMEAVYTTGASPFTAAGAVAAAPTPVMVRGLFDTTQPPVGYTPPMSDLKQAFLNAQQLQARKVAPVVGVPRTAAMW